MNKIKKVVSIILCLLVSNVFASMAFAENWERHTFKNLDFSIKCPRNWDIGELSQGALKDMVTIILPKNTARKKFRGKMVIVSSLNEKPSMPLENLYKMNINNISLSPNFPNFKLISSYNIKLGNRDAYQATFTYSHPQLGIKLKSFQIYTMTGKRAFVIQYAAPKSTYKKYMDEVNEIVRTFIPL